MRLTHALIGNDSCNAIVDSILQGLTLHGTSKFMIHESRMLPFAQVLYEKNYRYVMSIFVKAQALSSVVPV